MFTNKRKLIARIEHLEYMVSEQSNKFDALARHLKLNVHKPIGLYEIKEMPQYPLGQGLVAANNLNKIQ